MAHYAGTSILFEAFYFLDKKNIQLQRLPDIFLYFVSSTQVKNKNKKNLYPKDQWWTQLTKKILKKIINISSANAKKLHQGI